jgi:hypothetical protein
MGGPIALVLPDEISTVYLIPADPATRQMEDPGFAV